MKINKTSAFKLENLEPRLLFSADTAVAPILDGVLALDSGPVLQVALEAESHSAEQAEQHALQARELILIDGSVNDPLHLIEELQSPGDDNQHYAFYLLDAQKDGIEQISGVLERYQGVSAVHLISHGSDGQIQLGNTSLTADNLDQYAVQIQGWQQSMSEQADFLFYSCNLAQGEAGQALLQELQELTGADVAASDDVTGSSALGGDWELEYQAGSIETPGALDSQSVLSWTGTLATINVTTTSDVVDAGDGLTSLREAVIQANGTGATDTIILGPGTYTLTIGGINEEAAASGDLDITKDLIIQATDATTTIIDGNGLDRVFDVLSNDLTLEGVTVTGGDVVGGGGGGIRVGGSSIVTVNNSILSGNSTQNFGGAVNNAGTLIMDNVLISGNSSNSGGGGLYNTNIASLSNVTIDNNSTNNHGGGINNTGTLTLTNVTISNNEAGASGPSGHGGGIITTGSITADHVTIAFNSAPDGGGVYTTTDGIVDLSNSIISQNIDQNGGSPSEPYTSDGTNIIENSSTIDTIPVPPVGDIIGLSAGLNSNLIGGPIYGSLEEQPGDPADQNPGIGAQPAASGTTPVLDLDADDSSATGADYITTFYAGGGPVPIVDVDAILSDLDSPNLNKLEIRITNNSDRPNEEIKYDLAATGITANWSGTNGRLTLSGDHPISEYQTVLATLQYDNTLADPDATPRIIEITVRDTDNNTSNTATATVYIQKTTALWFTTQGDLAPGTGVPELSEWDADQVIALENPVFEPGVSGGNIVSKFNFSGPQNFNAIHFVSRNITVGGQQLQYGDLLLSDNNSGTYGGLPFEGSDLFVYRPDDLNNYNAGGSYFMLVENLTGDYKVVTAISLVEQRTLIGDTWVEEGTIIYGRQAIGNQNIYHYDPGTGDRSLLIDGSNPAVGIAGVVEGLELIEATTVIGGVTLQPGQILVTERSDGTYDGEDVFALTVTATEQSGAGNSSATHTLLFQGEDKGLENPANTAGQEMINGITLYSTEGAPAAGTQAATNAAPTITFIADQTIPENGSTGALAFSVGDAETAAGSLPVSATSSDPVIIPNGNLALVDLGGGNWTIEAAPAVGQYGGPVTITISVDDGSITTTRSFEVTVNDLNFAPVLGAIGNQTVDELATLSFSVSATDTDLPGDNLTYSLDAASLALGMTIDANTGDFSWTPTEAQGGLTPSVTITVTDDGTGTLSDSETFAITVNEVNLNPVLGGIGNQTVDELTTLTFTATATDSDLPANNLAFSLDAASLALGMTIDASSGAFSWTPSEGQSGVHSVTITVTDDGSGTLSDSESFDITVNELNVNPVLGGIGNQTVDELTTLTFTATATDSDLPANNLAFSLDAASLALGMTIDANSGAFSWTPTEGQGGLTPSVTITVTDDGTGTLTDSETFTITVSDINVAPVLGTIGNQTVDELTNLTFTATATDSDLPVDNLNFSLDAASLALGMTIDANTGDFSWTPTEDQDGIHSATITVTDDGTGNLVDSETFTVTVNEVNSAPVGGYITAGAVLLVQSDDGSGDLTISWQATDVELNLVTLMDFEYRLVSEGTWYSPSGGDSSGALTSGWKDNSGSGYTTDSAFPATTHSFTFNTKHGDVDAVRTLDGIDEDIEIRFTISDGDDYQLTSTPFRLDNEAPTPVITGAFYRFDVGRLVLQGSGFTTLAAEGSDIIGHQLDWDRLNINVNSDGDISNDIKFDPDAGDIESVIVGTDKRLRINLSADKQAELASNINFLTNPPETLQVFQGFFCDAAGNRALTDGTVISPPTAINGSETYEEDVALAFTSDLSISALNGITVSVKMTLSDPTAGSLSTGASGSASSNYDADKGEWTASGKVEDLNDLLDGLVFTPADDYDLDFEIQTEVDDGISPVELGKIVMTANPANDDPTLENPIGNQNATEDSLFSLTFAANTFGDIDTGDTLSYSATLAGGAPLPGWLNFDAGTRTFSGTPLQAAVGTISIEVTADDGNGGTVIDTFDLTVDNSNDSPLGTVNIDNMTPAQGDTLNATPGFTDEDGISGPISYQWQRDGDDISGATGTTYTVTQADVGEEISVVASYTDDYGQAESVTSADTAPVTNVNDDPGGTLTIDNPTPAQGDTLGFTSTLSDDDGISGAISYQWRRGGTDISGATGTSYTTTQADVGTAISVVASYVDDFGQSESLASADTAPVTNVNDRPDASGTYSMADTDEDTISAMVRVGDIFADASITSSDIDGDTLGIAVFATKGTGTWEYSTDGVSGWTAFGSVNPNAALLLSDSSYLRYRPDGLNGETAEINFRAWDQTLGTASVNGLPSTGDTAPGSDTTFGNGSASVRIIVRPVNDAPVLGAIGNQTVDELTTLTFTATATDSDVPGDSLSYSLDATSLAAGMTIDANSGAFSWTPTEGQDGVHSVTITVTDDGSGTLTDSETFTIAVGEVNVAPVLGAIGNQTVDELTTLAFTATASDSDLPANTLTYSLDATSLAAGMTIDANSGAFSWTPTEGQDGVHSVTVTVTDDGAGNLSDSETFTITVGEVNVNPVLSAIGNQTVDELTNLSFTATATDSDLPANNLTFSLDATSLAAGMTIDANTGDFSWTPTEGQGGVHSVTVTVTDDGSGNLTDSETFNITVNEVNVAPALGAIGNQTLDELTNLSFTATATDSDLPVDNLSFSLDATSLAAGMTIDANTGAFSWTPTEAQGGVHSVTVTVTDDGTGNLTDSETFTITVNEVNVSPVLGVIGNQTVDELTNLSITATATDSDVPVDNLSFSLDATSLAAGMTIDANSGAFSWTPTEGQGGVHSVTITVADDGAGNLSDSETFTITVGEVNVNPVLGAIGDQTVDELTNLSFTATAADSDLPVNNLTFSLDAASLAAGMTIDANSGAFSWTPTEGQDGVHSVTITVTDDGVGNLSDSETFTITVGEVNVNPVLGAIGNQTVDELTNLSFTATATDADLPVNNLTFSLDATSLAAGMTIDANSGAFSWTPTEGQDGVHSVTVTVTDDGAGNLTDSETFDITVNDVNVNPILGTIGNQTVAELTNLSFTATAADSDLPVNNLTFSLDAASLAAGMTIDANSGAFSWTPTESQGGVHSVTITVTDDGTGNQTDSETFTITVNEVNVAPVLGAIGNQTVDELTTLSFTATATDSDVPVDSLSYSLDTTSLAAGMTIDANTGDFSWTPTESQGGVHSVTITVTDDGSGTLTDSETFTITVGEVNVAPVLGAIGNQAVDELTTLSITAAATDSDVPVDNLSYSLDAASLAAGMTIDANSGAFSWTPTESQGGVHSVTITVTDDGNGKLTDSGTFTITVGEVNVAPVLGAIGDQTVDELTTLTFTATATDSDVPANTLTYTLDAASLALGMTIDPGTGAFSWTPSEGQGGLTPSVTITVTDDGTGNLVDSETFSITVNDINHPPVLDPIGDQTAMELAALTFTATATDSDLPVDTLAFSLDAASVALGMGIDSNTGVLSWTPSAGQGGLTHSVTITVTDSGTGNLIDSETFTISVGDANTAPILGAIGDQTVDELTPLTFIASATDSDVPVDSLTFSLDATSLAAGMTIDANTGVFSWTPTEGQGGLTPSVTVTVTDNGTGNLTDSETFNITVNEVNVNPVLGAIGDQTVDELTSLTFTATATDSDVPVDTLTYSLDAASLALGMTIDANTGDFSWTPTEGQGGVHSVTVTVTDDGTGALTDSETFTITVNEVNVNPVLGAIGNQTVDELTTLSFTATATDSDVPVDNLTFSLDATSLAAGMTIDANTGDFSWTPTEAQGGLTPSVTITVTDSGSGHLTDSETFTITVNDINISPTTSPVILTAVDEDSGARQITQAELLANAHDDDGDPLTATNLTITSGLGSLVDNGDGTWSYTPAANDDTAVSFSYLLSDGTVTLDGIATLDIKPVNDAPIANDDYFTTFEDNAAGIEITPLSDLLANDSDSEGTGFSFVKADPPAHGTLEFISGKLIYTPEPDFFGIDTFDYTIEDGDFATATATAIIAVTPVADTPQTMDVSVTVGSQSELIILDRNAVDGTEVTHFRITGISNGTLYLADGVTEVGEGDFITVAQGQAGLRFTPGTVNIADGSVIVESSLDGTSVSGEAAVVTVTVTPLSSDPDTRADDPEEKTDDKTTDEKTDEENSEDNAAGILIKDDDLTPSLPTVDESRGPEKNFFTHLRKNRSGDEDSLQSIDALFIELPSSLDKLRIMVDKTAYSGLLQAFENLDIPSLSLDAYQQVKDTLDAIKGEMEQDSKVERMVIVSSVATSVGLSAGYVVWLLQGGTLLTSVLASMPAWQLADPLSILAGRNSDDEDDDESLEDIITEGKKKINGKSKPDAGESP